MTDLIAELADCPFCDGEAWLREETTAPKDCRHYARCQSCGAETALRPTPEIAAEAWNNRTHHAEIAAAVRDAARYRFICPRLWPDDVRDAISTYPTMFPSIMDLDVCREHAQKVSRLIDTAMRAGEGEG